MGMGLGGLGLALLAGRQGGPLATYMLLRGMNRRSAAQPGANPHPFAVPGSNPYAQFTAPGVNPMDPTGYFGNPAGYAPPPPQQWNTGPWW
jgi:hypothetical protein